MHTYVYLLASKKNGILYVGVTNDISRRVYEHKRNINNGFTKKYNVHKLVYFEPHDSIIEAIEREKQIKRWRREKKLKLIRSFNPGWADLFEGCVFDCESPSFQ